VQSSIPRATPLRLSTSPGLLVRQVALPTPGGHIQHRSLTTSVRGRSASSCFRIRNAGRYGGSAPVNRSVGPSTTAVRPGASSLVSRARVANCSSRPDCSFDTYGSRVINTSGSVVGSGRSGPAATISSASGNPRTTNRHRNNRARTGPYHSACSRTPDRPASNAASRAVTVRMQLGATEPATGRQHPLLWAERLDLCSQQLVILVHLGHPVPRCGHHPPQGVTEWGEWLIVQVAQADQGGDRGQHRGRWHRGALSARGGEQVQP